MDNQGITAEQLQQINWPPGGLSGCGEQQQQAPQVSGLAGLLRGAGSGIFGSPAPGPFAQKDFAGSLQSQLLQASVAAARDKSVRPEDAFMPTSVTSPFRKKNGCRKVRDYSEHLTRKDEKILSFEERQ